MSTPTMRPTLNVIVAPAGILSGVFDALQDWSAAGLVSPFLWIEPHMVESGRLDALSSSEGRLDGVNVKSLAGMSGYARIRVAVLVPALSGVSGVPAETEQAIVQHFESSFGATPVVRIRAIVGRAGETAQVTGLVVEGWHNIVLSPEESTGPGVGSSALDITTDPIALGAPVASSLSGILALWVGLNSSFLDNETPLPGKIVQITRSYLRSVDTAVLESELRSRVLDLGKGLPLPTRTGTATTYIDDAALAATTMADQLFVRHPGALRGPRNSVQRNPSQKIGLKEAVKMFGGFVLAAVKRAPRDWANSVMNRVKAHTADAVHTLIFGSSPSAYAVIVGGITADGAPASWLDIDVEITELARVLDEPQGAEHVVRPDQSGLWQDYVSGALTLSDAGDRSSGLKPVTIGTQLGVLRDTAQSVPGRAQAFGGISPQLAVRVGAASIEAYDVLGAIALEARLRKAQEQPAAGLQVQTAVRDIVQWQGLHRASFAAQVGVRIGQELTSATAEVRHYLTQLQQVAEGENGLKNVQAQQNKLARLLSTLLVVFLAVVGVASLLFATHALNLSTFLCTLAVAVVLWSLGSFLIFLGRQRALFALITTRRSLVSLIELNKHNLRLAVRDARRLADEYGQYLTWSRILSLFFEAPFGAEPDASTRSVTGVTGLPAGMRVGSPVVDESTLAEAAFELRQDAFTVGWLSQSWDAALADAATQIGVRASVLRDDPTALYREQGVGADSLLPLWSAALESEGLSQRIGDQLWHTVVLGLQDQHNGVTQKLVGTLVDAATGVVFTADEFMSSVDAPNDSLPDRFNHDLLTDGARARGLAVVSRSHVNTESRGLGRTVSLVQFSAGIAAYELIAYSDDDSVPASPEGDSAQPGVHAELFDGLPF